MLVRGYCTFKASTFRRACSRAQCMLASDSGPRFRPDGRRGALLCCWECQQLRQIPHRVRSPAIHASASLLTCMSKPVAFQPTTGRHLCIQGRWRCGGCQRRCRLGLDPDRPRRRHCAGDFQCASAGSAVTSSTLPILCARLAHVLSAVLPAAQLSGQRSSPDARSQYARNAWHAAL